MSIDVEQCAETFPWPENTRVEVPLLQDWAPLDTRSLFPVDRPWKQSLLRQIEKRELELPSQIRPSRRDARGAIHYVTFRLYHIARVLQTQFCNPNHGNYADPFLESLLILLSWKNRIENAQKTLDELRSSFASPVDILRVENQALLHQVVNQTGFNRKRPSMVVELVRAFSERFPEGTQTRLSEWTDEQIIAFLRSIQGIGLKSALCVLMYSLNRSRFPIDTHIRRVLRRAGLLQELFREEEQQLNHKQYQRQVERFVPPSVRIQLHTGLLALGMKLCRSTPRCSECPIRKNCAYFRRDAVVQAGQRNLIHVDLFCGAGGFGEGFKDAEYRTILAIDKMKDAVRTYRLNHPAVPIENVMQLDLTSHSIDEVRGRMSSWSEYLVPPSAGENSPGLIHVITAGIPCQGFSKAGYRARLGSKYDTGTDRRNALYLNVIHWTRRLQPYYVVIENVRDIKGAKRRGVTAEEALRSAFEDIGYNATYEVFNAADFGVSQTRHRFILIASHRTVPRVRMLDILKYRKPQTDLLTAIQHYPPIAADDGRWYTLVNGHVVTGHRSRFNNVNDLEIFDAIRPGEHYRQFEQRRSDIIYKRRAAGLAVYSTDSFGDKYHKLVPTEPSRAIVAHLRKDGNGYIHPEQIRSITPREAARIQSFDDEYVFAGSRGSRFVQIGNAIPPALAKAIAQFLASQIGEAAE